MTNELAVDAEALKAAERRGYSRGYAARGKRIKRQNDAERRQRERQAFLDRAFLAILPAAMNAQGWSFGDKPITSMEDRVKLAASWAESALKKRPMA